MSRSRSWCFTLNNPEGLLTDDVLRGSTYSVYQEELGQTHHFQGYIHWPQPKSLAQMRALIPGAHFEIARGTPAQVKPVFEL